MSKENAFGLPQIIASIRDVMGIAYYVAYLIVLSDNPKIVSVSIKIFYLAKDLVN